MTPPTETVKTALREVVEQFPQILSDPAPAIWLNAYKDSCIEYVVRVWTTTEDYWNVYYPLLEAVRPSICAARGLGVQPPTPTTWW